MTKTLSTEAVGAIFDTHSEDYDAVTDASIAFSGIKADFFARAKAYHLLADLRKHFGKTKDLALLDIGCGIGKYFSLLRDDVGSIEGVDVSEGSLDTARRHHPDIPATLYDGRRLPFPDNSFDVAYTVCVLHHVPPTYWQGFADEMSRVVRPGGRAYIFEHNPLNPLTRKAVNDCPYDEDAVLLRPRETETLFTGHTSRTEHILTLPAIGGLPKAIDRMFSKLPLGAQYCTTVDIA